LSLIYKGGELSTISTRGDGFSGEDVTANKEIIKNIPLFVEYFKGYETIEVRGEVYMEKEEFEKLNKKLLHEKKNFSSARNAASGIMRTIHHSSESKNLKFTAYQMIGSDLKSQSECLRKLNSLGFEVSEHEKIKEISQVLDFVNQRENERTNEKFESDGIVIKVDNEKFHQILGKTSRFPR
jgi:DNA ligase (NAD+)